MVTGPLSKIVVPVHRDIKVETKVLSSIQLVEDVSYGKNIDSIEWNATKALSKVSTFKVHKQGGRGTVGNTKPRCKNQGDSKRNKLKLGQVRAETSCQQM
ncbi:hypothetical protein Gogos_004229 [Gossypium gossypioides]|uniref:Uncharacterized protein n=1 Tax=Gossypium gossypioides TaxID=34282 RepID=A0A7J9CFX0_GOSGO|nr:hypothetical protein [Gossypium gossypioides]